MSVIGACRAVERGIVWLGALVAWVTLIPLIAVSVYDMVGWQFLHVGSTRLQELEWHLFLAVVMLGLGHAYLSNAHVASTSSATAWRYAPAPGSSCPAVSWSWFHSAWY